ncbi:hypothetical protein FCM35_KLT08629 [Carex littledalei]|uniref:Uncharacterized protein n=1 Tax=Carex littledalei TaxID=544730 RepID=A0A833QUL1_9POAL|nr:hypothetical protein FCM35_KLT08629 [Carex littledalei]
MVSMHVRKLEKVLMKPIGWYWLESELKLETEVEIGGDKEERRVNWRRRQSGGRSWNFYYKKRYWPRLPYPRVDGLHLKSYLEFLGDVECFIDPLLVANMFHIRAMPIDSRDEIHKTMFKEIKNFVLHPEIDGDIRYFYFYRVGTLGDASDETYGQLKASVGNDISKYVRKDGTRKIEEDERDDSSDFVCLIDNQKKKNLKASVGNDQKTENSKASVGNNMSKYVRKDGTRKIEEDEKDDSSDFVCLIDDQTINFVKDGGVSW